MNHRAVRGLRPFLKRVPIALILLGLIGCAGTGSPGDDLLRRGDYAAAIAQLERMEADDPDDPRLKRNLGIARLESGDPAGAVVKLQEALDLDPRDEHALYHLGRAAEGAGQVDLALDAYTRYMARKGSRPAVVRARLRELSRERIARDVQRAIDNENRLSVGSIPENTVAVPDFVNVAQNDDLAPLSRGLAVMLLTDLSKVEALRVLERARLGTLLEELEMAAPPPQPRAPEWSPIGTVRGIKERLAVLSSPSTGDPYYQGPIDDERGPAYLAAVRAFQSDRGLTADGVAGPMTRGALETALEEAAPPEPPRATGIIDPATAPRLGLLLGARRFVQGSFLPQGAEAIRLDAALAELPQGTLRPVDAEVSGPLEEVLHLEKDLVYVILKALGVEPTPREREWIDSMPTESLPALLAFGRGVGLEEEGRSAEALAAFREALQIDPGFEMAREMEEILEVDPGAEEQLDRAELSRTFPSVPSPRDRVVRTGAWVGLGPGPILDRYDDYDPGVTDSDKFTEAAEAAGEIVVTGDLPPRSKP